MKQQRKKVGIMGGTFDPIHMGHLILAQCAMEQHNLDEIWMMPNGNPKYKSDRQITDASHRLEMVRLAICDNPKFILSSMEVEREGYTYTYETVEQLKEQYPDCDFYFIIGADSLFAFDTWKNPERILAACTLLASSRNHISREQMHTQIDSLVKRYGGVIDIIDLPAIDISSNMLRQNVMVGKSIRYYVDNKVAAYIQKQELYRKKDLCE